MTKKVYFIRHGESEGNRTGIAQPETSPLSEMGLKQAQFLARRIAKIPVDLIVSSPFERARHTAEIVNKKLKLPIIESDLFVERRRPSQLLGKRFDDPENKRIVSEIYSHYPDTTWRHSDEENPSDLIERAAKAMQWLEGREAEKILVATHGIFLCALVGTILFGKEFTGRELFSIIKYADVSNTGITLCQFNGHGERETGNPVWRLITWNDHAHLG